MLPAGRSSRGFAKLAETRGLTEKVRGCLGGREFAFVSYRGDVQICGFLGISAGNLIENNYNFTEIWLGSDFLREIRDVSNYKDQCGNCEYVGVCGGCRARAYAMTGDYLGKDPICDYKPGEKKMSVQLTPLQKRLCNILQEGLPVCPRPFAEIAKVLDSSEEIILRQIRELKKQGVIRRLGAMINYRALGRVSTFVTAHVPQEDLQEVAEAVNKLAGVSHNYLRRAPL